MLAFIDLVSDVASTDIVYCTNDHVLVGFLKMHLIITEWKEYEYVCVWWLNICLQNNFLIKQINKKIKLEIIEVCVIIIST